MTLEKLLHTQQENRHVQMVPTLAELNRMLARDERELELFESLDEELEWAHRLAAPAAIPAWMRQARCTNPPPPHLISPRPLKLQSRVAGCSAGVVANGIRLELRLDTI